MRRQSGFTLYELVITVLVIGVLSLIINPTFSALLTSKQGTYRAQQDAINQSIGNALLQYASDSTALGALPSPYTGGGYTKTILNPANTTLASILTQNGVNPKMVNDDNYASQRVRVYQLITGLTSSTPLYFQSGPVVTLTYQYGAIYMTTCGIGTSSCNPTLATGVPGDSAAMTAANYTTWNTAGNDLSPYLISSLPLQKRMLATTTQRLDKLRDSLLAYFRSQQQTGSANDATNFYPPNPGTMGGQNYLTNQGCRDGWYDLSTDTVIFPKIGLSVSEFGTTAWGGAIQYCRDYDPDGSKGANNPPHYAAIRINGSVSTGSAPDAVVTSNNVVLTF